MRTLQTDLTIVGVGGAGSHTAVAAAQTNLSAEIALISKMYPMRSHIAAIEGSPATVARDHDSFEYHFHDTIAGGDQLCEQDVVDYFVRCCPTEMIQLELWGCPWSRHPDGNVNVHRFGGMKIERTWPTTDKIGFHMLHMLFRTSLQFPQIQRFDEYLVLGTLVDDGHIHGLVTMSMMEGTLVQIRIDAVVMVTGGAGRVYRYNTNGGIATGDGMDMVLGHGVPLRDMKFVQYHPTGLPGSGILVTENCCGEGGTLVNKSGYRYPQDYDMSPEAPLGEPKNKCVELGLRDKVSQAFWHEWYKGNTISTPYGDVVYLDLRHLGEKKLHERLLFTYELTKACVGIDPVKEPIPVCPTTHYTMGGIEAGQNCEAHIKDLFTVDGRSSVGLHGANHLGSNSLAELAIFGRLAGEQATERAATTGNGNEATIEVQAAGVEQRLKDPVNQDGDKNWAKIRDKVGIAMEEGCSIYRMPGLMQKAIDKLAELQECLKRIRITDTSNVFNTDLLYTIKLGHDLNVAERMAYSATARKGFHSAYQCLDGSCTGHDDVNFFKRTLVFRDADGTTRLEHSGMKIIMPPPAKHAYGGGADAVDKAEVINKKKEVNG